MRWSLAGRDLAAAVEAGVSEFLGRERYARAATSEIAGAGMRHGYCETTIKIAEIWSLIQHSKPELTFRTSGRQYAPPSS